ncbi:MAG: hypothetical protein V1667_00930, partial [bacterium]
MRREQTDNYKKLMPLKKIAEASAYSFGYVSILAQRKKLKVKKIGNKYYSTQEWFDRYLDAHARDGKKLPPEAARELTQAGRPVSESAASAELKNRIDNLVEMAIKQKFEERGKEEAKPNLKTSAKKNIAPRVAAPHVREEKKQEKKLDEILNHKIASSEAKLLADLVEPEIKFQSAWQENLKREAEDFSKQKNAAEKKIKLEIRNQAKQKIFLKIKSAIFSSAFLFVIPARACLSGRQAGIRRLKEFFGTMKNIAFAAVGKFANSVFKKFIRPLKIASAGLSIAAAIIIFSHFAPGASAGFERIAKNIFSNAVSQTKNLAERGLKSKYLARALEQAGNIKKFPGSENMVIPGKDSAARIKTSLDNLFLASAGKVNDLSLALTDGIKQRNKILSARLGAVKNHALFVADFWKGAGAGKIAAVEDKFFNVKSALNIIPDKIAKLGQDSLFVLSGFLNYEKESIGHIAMLASEKTVVGNKSDIKGRVAGAAEINSVEISPMSRLMALANTTSKRGGEIMVQAKYGAIAALNEAADTQKEMSLSFGKKLAKLVSVGSGAVGLVSESGKNKLASLEDSINKTNDSMRATGSAIGEYNNNGKKYLASQAGLSLRSLADMYSKIVDMIIPDSLKAKYAKLYNAGAEKETVIKETVVVKEKIQIPLTPFAKGGKTESQIPPTPFAKGGKDLSITGNADIGGDLNVSGASKFNGKISVIGQSEFFGDMVVDAALTAKTLLVTDYAQFAGAINAKAIAADSLTSRDSLTVVGGSFIGGDEIIKGNLAVSGTFSAGHTEFPSLGVTGQLGAGSLSAGSGGLVVSGNSYFSSPIDANDIFDLDIKSGSALTVGDGANDTFVVDTNSDIITIAAALNLNGNADINGSLDLDTASTSAFAVGDGTNDNFIIDTVNDAITLGYSSTTDSVTINNSQLAINSASSTTALLVNYGGSGNIMQILDDGVDRFSLADNGNIIQTASTTETALSVRQNGTGDILNLFDGANEIFTVLAGGNIGIGSTTPGYKLSVGGSGYFDGGIVTASGFIATSSISASYFTAMDALATSTFAGGFSAASSLYVLQTGNVGIGTTSPLAKLSIQGTAGQNIFDVASSTGQSLLTIDHTGQCVTGDTLLSVIPASEPESSISGLRVKPAMTKQVRIDQVKGGEYVMSLNEKTGKLEPAKIKGLLDMGVKPIYKITTEDGKTIRTTGNHPYLAKSQENKKTTKQLVSDVFSGGDFNNAEQIFRLGNIKDNSDMNTNAETILTEMANKFFDTAMMKRMGQEAQTFNFTNDSISGNFIKMAKIFAGVVSKFAGEHSYEIKNSFSISSPLIQLPLASASAIIEAYRSCAAGELNFLSHSSNLSSVNSNINSSNAATDALVFGSKTPTTDLSLMNNGCDNDKVCIDVNVNNLSDNNYNNDDSNLSNSKWTKVAELSVGDKIAVAADFSVIPASEPESRVDRAEQVSGLR